MSRRKSTLTLAAENEVLAQQSSDSPEETVTLEAPVEAPENSEVFPGLVGNEPAKPEPVKLSDLITAIGGENGNLKYVLKQDIGALKAGLIAVVASSTKLGVRYTPTKWVGASDMWDPISKRSVSNLPVAYAKEGEEDNTLKYLAATMSKVIEMATQKFVFVQPA